MSRVISWMSRGLVKLAEPRAECEGEAGDKYEGAGIYCGLEADHDGPHFSERHEVFWLTPDEALAMKEAVSRLLPEVWEKESRPNG